MGSRRSYSGLMKLPAWWLLDKDGAVVASVRAKSAETARAIFKRAGLQGQWVERGRESVQ